MNQISLFSSGLELANLVINSDILHLSWDAIQNIHRQIPPSDPNLSAVKYGVFHYPPNVTIVAFASSLESAVQHIQTEGGALISADELKGSFNLFDFVCTKVNPCFSINKGAITLFHSLLNELTLLKNQYSSCNSPLIITGNYLGGWIASLFTLWLLDITLPMSTKRPLCITFGSPLLGDDKFQRAISERPRWNSSFLHVVSNQDIPPLIFIPPYNGTANGLTSQACNYKPFGTFLLSSDSGCGCFKEPDSVLEILIAMGSKLCGNQNGQNILQITGYGQVLERLKHSFIRKGTSQLSDSIMNSLQAGIQLQLRAVGLETQVNGNDMNSLATSIVERVRNIQMRKRFVFDPNKKLKERKIDMTYVEWYMKVAKDQGGYYDSYKTGGSRTRDEKRSREEVTKRHRILTKYWKQTVAESEKMPQKEGAAFQLRWLYAGTNYRRVVEPLDIADYYKKGQKDYITRGRSVHYVLLEKWLKDDNPDRRTNVRKKACGLTEDSCFWAHVEEALISCRTLRDNQSSPEDKECSRQNLIKFEEYVMNEIQNFAVCPEIFLPQSSFMQWWEEYRMIVGAFYNSPLTDFMRNHYKSYA